MAASHEGVSAEPWPKQGGEQVVSGKGLAVSLLQYSFFLAKQNIPISL